MDKLKICRGCLEEKDRENDFYYYRGYPRSRCKKCVIQENGAHQKLTQRWKKKYALSEHVRAYYKIYYQENKEKFAQYRQTFRDRHPHYHRDYARRQRENGGALHTTIHTKKEMS